MGDLAHPSGQRVVPVVISLHHDQARRGRRFRNLARLGFKGIRLNLSTGGINDPNEGRRRFLPAAERVKNRNWHIQINTTLPMLAAMKDALKAPPK